MANWICQLQARETVERSSHPCETSHHIAGKSINWACSNSLVVVAVVAKDLVQMLAHVHVSLTFQVPIRTVPKLPTMLITKKIPPSFEFIVR